VHEELGSEISALDDKGRQGRQSDDTREEPDQPALAAAARQNATPPRPHPRTRPPRPTTTTNATLVSS